MTGYLDKWQSAADDLLSVLIAKPNAWIATVDAGVAADDLPAGAWRDVFRAVIDLRASAKPGDKDKPLLDTEIAIKAGASVTVEFVAVRIALYDSLRESTFAKTCDILKNFGRGHRQYAVIQRGLSLLKTQLDVGAAGVNDAVAGIVNGLQVEQSAPAALMDIGDLSEETEKRMTSTPEDGIKAGIWLLDEWLRGMSPGELVAFVAPYKSRKTSVMSNVILGVARQGKQINVFSFDEARIRFVFRLQAVLMAEYMFNNGHWDAKDERGLALNVVDGKMIGNAGNRHLHWDKRLQLAREYARDTLLGFRGRIRLYDRQTCGGTLASIRALCRLDAAKAGGIDVLFVDHIQRLGDWTKTYEQVEFGSAGLHDLAGELGAVAWVLSQQNEAAIKTAAAADWSPNVKGGGGLASNADTVIISKYRTGTVLDADKLRLDLRLARDAAAPRYGYVEIHPSSGWITPRRIDTKTVTQAAIQAAIGSGEPPEDIQQRELDLGGGSYV